ncbi:LigB subunit of an aromatic-ring-opening dioxygenase LigAB [Aspergillus heteromorphus CBS 117.55]|uniref:LigB subunit of an aromatic-ring-opening dioxygenase LigAB n=1 Tax=Aspergillus heteromorphus CBS 117.55 TaxID=1448321 RepID=A0A317WWD8_9EURO|nr:LigB subunit of an aromatic-ring-opening dioxygenase LigAB [Aspergillus heteromorphus CBS 117.55]PWY90706.1 LigB subunit of an aromatic-ring-opening dioxygenase LigAB [Aspergillus heteromorphus CBS 117.55]
MGLTPVHFFSHGSPMMLCQTTASSEYWRKCGEEALAQKVKGIVMMSSHWTTSTPSIHISTNPSPNLIPIPFLPRDTYTSLPSQIPTDLPTAHRIIALLSAANIPTTPDPTYNYQVDVYIPLLHMFPIPTTIPPVTILSTPITPTSPHFHLLTGQALRLLRQENYLLLSTGGTVHNLYRNRWMSLLRYRDSLAQETPPEGWALEFRGAVEDVFTRNIDFTEVYDCTNKKNDDDDNAGMWKSGTGRGRSAGLAGRVMRLMKHPRFREAHATDEHFLPVVWGAGAVGGFFGDGDGIDGEGDRNRKDTEKREREKAVLGAETWELGNMANLQFTVGRWG